MQPKTGDNFPNVFTHSGQSSHTMYQSTTPHPSPPVPPSAGGPGRLRVPEAAGLLEALLAAPAEVAERLTWRGLGPRSAVAEFGIPKGKRSGKPVQKCANLGDLMRSFKKLQIKNIFRSEDLILPILFAKISFDTAEKEPANRKCSRSHAGQI